MLIQQAYEKLGNRWTQIAELLPVSIVCSARFVVLINPSLMYR